MVGDIIVGLIVQLPLAVYFFVLARAFRLGIRRPVLSSFI